jgi:DNA-binding transcriptional ArsR family regulator
LNHYRGNLLGVLADADLSAVAELMTAHRATMLLALMGGRSLTAGELAEHAAISPSLASSHLSKLLDGGLVMVSQDGRRRHYQLTGPRVAEVIEAMLTIAPGRDAATLRESARGDALRGARTCYDHLAGALGVAVTDALEHRRVIEVRDDCYALTAQGARRLEKAGIDVERLRGQRRTFARPCLDWTERRPHLAGALGAGIAAHALERKWVRRLPGSRALRVTDVGRRGFLEEFGLNLPAM